MVQRDFGNRSDRKIARLKYLIASWGVEKFKEKVEEYYGHKLPAPKPVEVTGVDDHIGWHEQGDGKWFLGINIENGRIKDLEVDIHDDSEISKFYAYDVDVSLREGH